MRAPDDIGPIDRFGWHDLPEIIGYCVAIGAAVCIAIVAIADALGALALLD